MSLLDKIKVGSNVFHITKGWGVVSEIDDDPDYPILVNHGGNTEYGTSSYTASGLHEREDLYPSIFLEEMTATPTPYLERTPPLNSIIWSHNYGYGKVTELQNLTEDDCPLITCTFDSLGGAARDLNRSEIWLPQEFHVGDEVKDAGYGKGIVTKVDKDALMPITVEYTGLQITYTLYGQSVLHTIPTLTKVQ